MCPPFGSSSEHKRVYPTYSEENIALESFKDKTQDDLGQQTNCVSYVYWTVHRCDS